MRVGLPMYDPPEFRREVDAWWSGLAFWFRSEGVANVPESLDRSIAFDALWSAPDLLFAQACGYPMVGRWAGRLEYLATPRYAAPGCDGTSYCSWIVVAANSTARTVEGLRGTRCSINSRISHSGCNALRALVAPLAEHGRFFGSVIESGGHLHSLKQIERGEADVAAIDCVTHALLKRCRPELIAATRILARTVDAPGLPYVTRAPADSALLPRLRAGLVRAFADPALRSVRDVLLIAGIEVLPVATYGCMTAMEAEARRRRYFELD